MGKHEEEFGENVKTTQSTDTRWIVKGKPVYLTSSNEKNKYLKHVKQSSICGRKYLYSHQAVN